MGDRFFDYANKMDFVIKKSNLRAELNFEMSVSL